MHTSDETFCPTEIKYGGPRLDMTTRHSKHHDVDCLLCSSHWIHHRDIPADAWVIPIAYRKCLLVWQSSWNFVIVWWPSTHPFDGNELGYNIVDYRPGRPNNLGMPQW